VKKCKIYTNGKLIGTCDDPEGFVEEMRQKRRSGEVSYEMNITHYQKTMKYTYLTTQEEPADH
jgi:DNA-directed RNA polymerase subunit B'